MAAEEDAVKVCVRVRPTIQREQEDQVNLFWKAENSTISQIDGTRYFNFDRVFNSLETTNQVYQGVAVPIIRSALQGYNGTIFAYGQTSSGKTYTMMGSPDNLGIIPQAVEEVFRIIQDIPSREFLLRVSYMEIYNETVTDLLCDSRKKKPLEIREDINRNVYVADLTEELVMCPEHVLQWIKKGEKNRHYGETKMNERSSRSHTIFRMIVESRERNDPGNSENCEGAVMVSHLNLVDLAGSERASQTGAEGVRLKEGCNINRSLFILGQVIKKLSDDQSGAFINYRDSKLTRILQNSLGGNTKTVIICTITAVSFDETLSTLQFASAAKNVKNKPHVNEVLDDEALLKRYRKEIMDLKKQLEDLEASSVSKAHAMANEEHSQLLAVIQQLQKEKEERVSNLKNIVVDAALYRDISQEDQQHKRKRRVTWGAEKIQCTLYGAGVGPFDAGAKISASFPKRAKMSDLQTISENDDSVCTEFSDIDESTRVIEDFFPDRDVGSRVTLREKIAFHHSMIDFNSDAMFQNGALLDSSSPKYKELKQKLAELEKRLQEEIKSKESFEEETLQLKKQLEAKEKDELVKTHQLEITTEIDQLQNRPENNEDMVELGASHELKDLDSELTLCQVKMNNSHQSTQTVQIQENCMEEHPPSHIHNLCQEQIQMLEQKIADMKESNQQSDFVESLQICEALMVEKETALSELTILRENFDNVVVENESMKQEIAVMEKYLQEKNETNEFETLEKETQKEHETQLIHEIGNLKKVIANAELYNQELEAELENKSKVLKEQEKQITELKKDAEVLLKKDRYSDLSISMGGDSEKLYEEVFQLKQSLGDAETVTRDAQRESAFLRSENLELKEKMDDLTLRCQQREKDASACEKQLELEKANYKSMQADLQKELQCAFNEINQLNGLMAGRVPKDLLSRVELDKQIADFSKQLSNALAEKNTLEEEVAYLSELKSLPSEIEVLKSQVQKTSEELHLLQNEKEQFVSTINDQACKMQEQKEQVERLMEDLANTEREFQQYSELKILHEDLQTRCLLTDEEIKKNNLEAECLVKEINDLKQSLELLEGKLSRAHEEREELVQAQQENASRANSMEDILTSTVSERDNLQNQVSKLSSLVETLQQQAERQSEVFREKQDLEQKHLQLISEKEQLQEQLNNWQPLPSAIQSENSEAKVKFEALQEEMTLFAQQRDELHSKIEELTVESNILKQDLNDNIEMSIETQNELRTTQEELKYQKQLVSDLRKQISDHTEHISIQTKCHKNIQEASEENSEAIADEEKEAEADNLVLISEMEVLKERLKSAELALATIAGEKHELLQKLSALEEDLVSLSKQKDELYNIKNNLLVEKDDLGNEVKRTAQQVCELNEALKCLSEKSSHEDVTGQLLEPIQEREKLLETLKAVTDERDQLRLDLHDNIEMSIETQEELRHALDEVKEKSALLDTLKSQVDGAKCQTNPLEKDLEVKILHLEEQLQATVNERDQLNEEFRLLTEQNRSLEESLSATKYGHPDNGSQDKEVPEVLLDEAEIDISARLEQAETERTLLKEKIDTLQQQIHIISHEKEHQQQLIASLQAENLQLLSVVQKQTQDGALQGKATDDLTSKIEKLNEQLENTNQQLALKEQEAKEAAERLMELNNTLKPMAELEMLERNLQETSILLERIQGEKLELSNKLCTLQEELEKVTCCRDNLQDKLEIVLGENESLKGILETTLNSSSTQEKPQRCQELQQDGNLVACLKMQIPGSISVQDKDTSTDFMPFMEEQAHGLEVQLLQKTSENEQLVQKKNELEEDKKSLNCEVESLTNRLAEAQTNLESLHNAKYQTEEKLLDLQQKLNAAVQDRDDLKIAQEILIAEADQLKRNIKENDEMAHGLQEQLLQKTSEFEQMKNKLEEDRNGLNCEVESLTNRMTEAQANLESLRNEKHRAEEQIIDLQQKLNAAVVDGDDLKMAQERLIAEIDQLKRNRMENDEMLQLQEAIQQRTECQHEEFEQTQHTLKIELKHTLKDLKSAETQLEALRSFKLDTEKNLLYLQHTVEIVTQERDDLKASQENLTLERNQLIEALEKNNKILKTAKNRSEQLEVAAQTDNLINSELGQLLMTLKDTECHLATVELEKVNTEEKFFSLQKHMEVITKEREELQVTLQSLQSERDQLKEDLRKNTEMSNETQVDLRNTHEELHQQRERVSELTKEIYSLEQKSVEMQNDLRRSQEELQQQKEKEETLMNEISLLEEKLSLLQRDLQENITQMNRAVEEKEMLDQEKQMLSSDIKQLTDSLKSKDTMLELTESEKSRAAQKVLDLIEEVTNISREREQLQLLKKNLEEELSLLQRELQENITLLKGAVEEKEMLAQEKQMLSSDIKQLTESLKSKDTMLELTESEKGRAAQKVLDLTEEVTNISREREQLQLLKENLEEEATKLREDFKHLQSQHEQETQQYGRLEELLSEIEQLKEKITLKDESAQQLEIGNADLQRQVQKYELEVASFHQEQEQFQQLLQRVRSEKENICTSLQDQEKANLQLRDSLTTSQTELELINKQRDENEEHFTAKVNEINALLEQVSSLQEQIQQLHQELKDERIKNSDLYEKVNDLEREIRVLHLMQNEPVQEEDEVAERTESLQQKNQELKDLMVTISTVYTNRYSLLSNLSVELQSEIDAQSQSMSVITESLSSTHSKASEALKKEYVKLNSQLQTLLNKFKVIYRNAAVKEEQYNLVNGYESDLCALQKKNDELLLQCQSLEQTGTKWPEGAAEDLKFCELEFLNHLIFKKIDVLKLVEDGFSEVQVALSTVEGDLIEELKYKKQFLSWLEEFKGLQFDAKKFSEGIVQENKRISTVVQLLAKRLKVIVQSRIKQNTMAYLNQLDEELREKKEKNKELLQRMQLLTPSGDSNILEEENARLYEKLKNLQAELKNMQCRIQQLQNEVASAKADAQRKGEKASLLQEKLLSSVTENEILDMQAKISEKEKYLETAQKEIKTLQEKVAQGAAPYYNEIDSLKNKVVRFEMERMKLSKSTDQQIASLKSCVEYKEGCLRKLKEQLRRTQKDTDTTVCSEKDGSASYPLTCGGGSGIVQSTTMLMLQSENAALKREITHYKKKCHQLSRSTSSREDETKKLKDRSVEAPSNLFSSLTDTSSQSSSGMYKQAVVSPHKSDNPPSHICSPGNTGMYRKRAVSPSKTHLPKPQVMSPIKAHIPKPQMMSPNKTARHSAPVSSPVKTELNKNHAVSPLKAEGQLFSNLTESPCKKQRSTEFSRSPKDKCSVWSKSLPYCPTKFFDNSTLGTLPDPLQMPSDNNTSETNPSSDISLCVEAEADIYSETTTETSEVNWWDREEKNQNPNECSTS
ncbi:centromere-associated protein E [Mantella aurantiaca]